MNDDKFNVMGYKFSNEIKAPNDVHSWIKPNNDTLFMSEALREIMPEIIDKTISESTKNFSSIFVKFFLGTTESTISGVLVGTQVESTGTREISIQIDQADIATVLSLTFVDTILDILVDLRMLNDDDDFEFKQKNMLSLTMTDFNHKMGLAVVSIKFKD